MNRYPLLPIAAAFAAGIGAAPHFYLTAAEQIVLLTVVCAGAGLLVWTGRGTPGLISCWLGFFLCGSFFAAADHHYTPPDSLRALDRAGRFDAAAPLEITGWVRSPTKRRPGSEYFDLSVEEIRQPGNSFPATGGVRLYHFRNPDFPASLDVPYGARLTVSLDGLRRPRNFLTPGSFDWEAYMRRQEIDFTARLRRPGDMQVLPGRHGSAWRAAVFDLRSGLLAGIDRLYSAGPEGGVTDSGAILRAMLLGDDDWLRPEVESAFQASGTYHILVVSGWNVFALAVPLLWITARLRFPEWLGALIVAAAVVGFALLAEGGAPVSRAALMFLIYLSARYIYRERAALNSIAAAALILLALHPSDLWDPGFQLSFFAVLVLAAIAVPLIQWVASPYRHALRSLEDRSRDFLLQPRQQQFRNDFRVLLDYLCPRRETSTVAGSGLRPALSWSGYAFFWLLEGLLFTALIQTGLSLAMAAYFHRITWSGILANLVVLPVASGIVLLGLPVLLLSFLWWGAAQAGAVALGWVASALLEFVRLAGSWSLLNYRVPAPPAWLSVIFCLLLVALALQAIRRSRWTWLTAASLACLCVVLTIAPYPERLPAGQLEVAILDVGQGDSIFAAFPDGTTLLVDGGGVIPIPGSSPPRLDIGESVVSSYLWSRNIQAIDYVVLTHSHWDHFGGLPAVLRNFRVGEFWMGPDPEDRNMDWLRGIAAQRGTRIERPAEGTKKPFGQAWLEILSPPGDWDPRRVSNNDSIVLQLRYGEREILLPGDVESRMENLLAQKGETLSSEVLKVAHHGSRTSTTAQFLAEVAPQFGIISVGAFRRFGHPQEEVLEALRTAGVRTYRTDLDGTITVSTDGHRLNLSTYRDTLRPWPRFLP